MTNSVKFTNSRDNIAYNRMWRGTRIVDKPTLRYEEGCLTARLPPCVIPSVIRIHVLGTPCLGAPLNILSFTSFKARCVSVEPPVYRISPTLFLTPCREYKTESSKVRSMHTWWSYLKRANLQQKWKISMNSVWEQSRRRNGQVIDSLKRVWKEHSRFKPWVWVILLSSSARHRTLTVPFTSQGYRWVPSNCQGSLEGGGRGEFGIVHYPLSRESTRTD